MSRILFIFIFLATSFFSTAQMSISTVAFYNVENMFDTINDPVTDDGDFTPRGKYRWNAEAYNAKISNIAKVAAMLKADILGLAEVESSGVLDDLINTKEMENYDYVHFDSRDSRGIDVALLYDVTKVELTEVKPLVYKNGAYNSRDILYVYCKLNGNPVHILVCHLPSVNSRAKYRRMAVNSVRYYVNSIAAHDKSAKIIVMGDFNFNPRSKNANALRIGNNGATGLHNPFKQLHDKGYGSYMYRGKWNMYDMIFVNRNMLTGHGLRYIDGSERIFIRDFLIDQSGRFKGYPLRAISNDRFTGGYSDHLPVYINLAF